MRTGLERGQRLAVRGAQFETANALCFDDFASNSDFKHDFPLHIEVAAEKKRLEKRQDWISVGWPDIAGEGEARRG
ncbi:hypothetical protein PS3A_39350 [Pseudomonas sp. 3A(2025)]